MPEFHPGLWALQFHSLLATVLFAQQEGGFWERHIDGLLGTLLFGGLGIVLGALSFKIFDWVTPNIQVEKELSEKHNVAVAIVCASLILGICYIVAAAVKG
jgi:uncharacterized membrane protein YjfL (UPF0719 family)